MYICLLAEIKLKNILHILCEQKKSEEIFHETE